MITFIPTDEAADVFVVDGVSDELVGGEDVTVSVEVGGEDVTVTVEVGDDCVAVGGVIGVSVTNPPKIF